MNWTDLTKAAELEIAAVMQGFPEDIRERVNDAAILLERAPDEEDVTYGIEPDTLGLFDIGEEELPRIRLWLENIWDYAEFDEDSYREEVRTTLLHEIGHLLGWDEEDLDERGLG